MPGTTKTQASTLALAPAKHAPCARPRTRRGVGVRALLCAVSVIALSTTFESSSLIAPAYAQQTPDAVTQELFLAVDRNDLEAVKAAIDKGADVEARDYTGTQPVDMAIDRGYFDIAHYLISVRNAKQAQNSGQPALPAPSAEALAQAQAPVADAPPLPQSPIPESPFKAMTDLQPEATTPTTEDLSGGDLVGDELLAETSDANPFDIEQIPPTPPEAPSMQETPMDEMPGDELAMEDVPATADTPSALNGQDAPTTGEMQIGQADLNEMELTEPNPFDPAVAPTDPFAVTTPPDSGAPENETPEIVAQIEAEPEPGPAPPAPTIDVAVPEQAQAPAIEMTEPETAAVEKTVVEKKAKPSAAKTFITTFFDFFKPPNVTGVTRHEAERRQADDRLSDEELARQLHAIEAERGDDVIKGPEVPISPEELASQLPPSPDLGDLTPEELAALSAETPALPPYPLSSTDSQPMPAPEDAFGDLSIEEVTPDDELPLDAQPTDAQPSDTAGIPAKPGYKEAPGVPGKRYDPTKPFGGGVDPDILAWLGLDERTGVALSDTAKPAEEQTAQADPEAAEADPFASPFETLDGAEEPAVSDLLEGLDEPQDVASRAPKSPPPPGASDDPFASVAPSAPSASDDPFAADDPFSTPPPPPGGDVDELAGLLEMTGENVEGSKGWDVTKVEGANLPSEAMVLSELEPTGEILDGVELALGADTMIGKEVGEERLKLMDQETIHKPCISKGGTETVFCIDTISWPFELEESFLVDTIMYQGTRAVTRYDAGRATNFHTLFRTEAFENVIAYYTNRYGPPTQFVERAIAPLAAPRQENPTYLWQSREPGTDTISILEIRKFDDAQPGFPDTNRGVLLLYRSHAKPIFPQLSQLELMVLKADAKVPVESTEPTPGDVWN